MEALKIQFEYTCGHFITCPSTVYEKCTAPPVPSVALLRLKFAPSNTTFAPELSTVFIRPTAPGAVRVVGGNLQVSGSKFENALTEASNYKEGGGAIFVQGGGMYVEGSVFTNCQAPHGVGGAVLVVDSPSSKTVTGASHKRWSTNTNTTNITVSTALALDTDWTQLSVTESNFSGCMAESGATQQMAPTTVVVVSTYFTVALRPPTAPSRWKHATSKATQQATLMVAVST